MTDGLRARRLKRAALLLVLLGLVYAAVGFLAVPRWIAATARDQCRDRYARELTLGAVRFNPFTLSLEISDLRLPDADRTDLLRWRRLAVAFAPLASLWRRGMVFRRIELDAPSLHVVRRMDGRWNLQDLAPDTAAAAKPTARSAPLRLWIDLLAVRAGGVSVADRWRGPERLETLSPIDFTLSHFSTAAAGDRYQLRASSTDLGKLEWHGTIEVSPLRSSGEFRFAGINLPRVATWIGDTLPFSLSSGTVALEGGYQLAMAGERLELDARVAQLEATAVGIRARGETEDSVDVPRLLVSAARFEFPARRLQLAAVSITAARATVALDEKLQPNLLRLLGPPSAAAGAAPNARTAAPLLHWTLAPIDLSIRDLSWPAQSASHVEASVVIDGTGRVAVSGSVDARTQAIDLDLDAARVDLRSLQPLLARTTSVMLLSGAVGARGKLSSSPGTGAHYSGSLSCEGLRLSDPVVREDLLRWKALEISAVEIAQRPLAVSAREVVAREPYARLIIARDGTTNLSDALAAPGTRPAGTAQPVTLPAAAPRKPKAGRVAAHAPAAKAASAAALPIEIRRLRIVDGVLNFADYTLPEKFATGISQLHGNVDGLSGKAGSRATVQLDGQVDRFAPVSIRGQVNYFEANSYTDVTMSFHNIELTTFSPYSGKFAGYRIERGKLSVDAAYQIVDRRLAARHHVVINQLQLGERVESKDAVSLPLKLAVALLKDRNGVIDLDLPMTGSLDDPTFRIAPLVWKILKNLLVKVVTAPFALLGSLFGGGPELEYVDFPAGSATLQPGDAAKLEKLRHGLVDRPALNLDVPLVRDAEHDEPALAAARWAALLADGAVAQFGERARAPGFLDQLRAKPVDYLRFLELAGTRALGHKPELPSPQPSSPPATGAPPQDPLTASISALEAQLRATVTVSSADLDALAKARAEAVQQVLLTGGEIDPARIFVIARPATGSPATPAGSDNGVRLQLSLK